MSQCDPCDIPIWIDLSGCKTSVYRKGKSKLLVHKAEVWLSIAELREQYSIPNCVGQDNEWLACGRIPVSRVEQIMPYNEEGLFELPHLNVTSGSYIFDFQRQIWLPNTLRIHDRKATDVEQGRWRTKFDTLRQIITRIVIGRTNNWPVTISDIWSLLKAVHDLRDAASLIADYYESVSMTTFGQRSLDDKAKMHRDLSLWCSISSKDMEDNVEALMACMDKDAEEDDVVNPLVVGLGTLGMQN
jgi:hypothetical protein